MASGHRRAPHPKAGHMAAPTSESASGQQNSCQHGAVHTWRKADVENSSSWRANGPAWAKCGRPGLCRVLSMLSHSMLEVPKRGALRTGARLLGQGAMYLLCLIQSVLKTQLLLLQKGSLRLVGLAYNLALQHKDYKDIREK